MSGGRAWLVSQGIAVFCIIFGALLAAWGCMHGQSWEALKTMGAGVAGAGINAFTTQYRQTLLNKDGGTVNVDATGATKGSE